MLDQSTRTAILRLHEQGHGSRAIADAVGVSRNAVKKVLGAGSAAVPPMERAEKAEPYRDRILALITACKGNLVRVHETLIAEGATLSYAALTAYCRRHSIGHVPKQPAGLYEFPPGKEMQHDTSPHSATVGGRAVPVQTASLVLGYSRMVFAQFYPRFTRFECKLFLSEGLAYFDGACERCIIDNTHVVVLRGSGRDMVPVPEMVAFGDRFGFEFAAHAIGDKNRSGKVERPFHYIENNFLAGRTFADWDDLNAQGRAWCDRINAMPRRHLHASARELFAVERPQLRPLPIHVPEVYRLHHRIVDSEGLVNVSCNRYSAPWTLIARSVEVRECKDRVEIYDGPRCVATHKRWPDTADARIIDPAHRPPRGQGSFAQKAVSHEEQRLTERAPEAAAYIKLLRKRGRGSTRDLRGLFRMLNEYPRDAFRTAIEEAERYGMTDLDRLERMVLRRIAREFFVLPGDAQTDPHDPEGERS